MPDFMVWSGVSTLPWFWYPFAKPAFRSPASCWCRAWSPRLFSWLVFRRRIGGVYFALITQALALAFSTLLVSQQSYTGGFNGLTDFSDPSSATTSPRTAAQRHLLDHRGAGRRELFLPALAARLALRHAAARHARRREPRALPGP
jgi:ABC-type branched-subunit amino acid transport system permease subunit